MTKASIKTSELNWASPIHIHFGVTGLDPDLAVVVIRDKLEKQWPEIHRPKQCVYIIRLRGDVAVAYGDKHSPVVYIGEGNAYSRLYDHANWLSALLSSIPNAQIEVHIVSIARRNNTSLCEYVEADLLSWFFEDYGMLPWFNKQRERSKEAVYAYDSDAGATLKKRLKIGATSSFLWAIRPTPANDQFIPYAKGAGKIV